MRYFWQTFFREFDFEYSVGSLYEIWSAKRGKIVSAQNVTMRTLYFYEAFCSFDCNSLLNTFSTAELGSNPGYIFIKRHDIPLDRKLPKLFDRICCHSISVKQKKLVLFF